MPTLPNFHLPKHNLVDTGRSKQNLKSAKSSQTTTVFDRYIFSDGICVQVWDIAEDAPKCVQEREMKLGRLHCAEGCPDAPFVVCMGGDKNSDNLKVLDVRESADGEWFALGRNI